MRVALGRVTMVSLGILALAAAPALGNEAVPDAAKRLSGATPFASCPLTGTRSLSSEAEPHLAVAPRNPRRLIATWQQDRFSDVDGGAAANLAASSGDGGVTWRTTTLPGMSRCTGGEDQRASDPWVSIGADRSIYQSSLTFTVVPALSGLAGPTAQRVATSTDGGATFSQPTTVVDQNQYDDREAIKADPQRPGHAYMVWVRRLGLLGEQGIEYFSRTTDGGRTFTAPRPITAPNPGTLPDPALLEVLPDGSLLNVYMEANATPFLPESVPRIPWVVRAQRSTDGGDHWSAPVEVGRIAHPGAPEDPDSGAEARAFNVVSIAVTPDGTAYAVWNEIKSESSSVIALSRSGDGGRSWSPASTVAAVPSQAFLPNVAVMPDGTVGVTYDDFRGDREGDGQLTTNVWFTHSHNGGTSWREQRLAGPFDMLQAPETSSTEVAGRFLGDYQGLVGLHDGFGALYAQARPAAQEGPSDVFFSRVCVSCGLRLAVRPRRVRAGRRTRFRFLVTERRGGHTRRVRGATVRFAGRRVRTNRRGRATLRLRMGGLGRRRARASKAGHRSARATVRVLPRQRRVRLTG
jgi:hypothetical protein